MGGQGMLQSSIRTSVLKSTQAHAGDFRWRPPRARSTGSADGVSMIQPGRPNVCRRFMHAESMFERQTTRRPAGRRERDRRRSWLARGARLRGTSLSSTCAGVSAKSNTWSTEERLLTSFPIRSQPTTTGLSGACRTTVSAPASLSANDRLQEMRLSKVAKSGGKVSVTAIDNDLSITGNLDNYDDQCTCSGQMLTKLCLITSRREICILRWTIWTPIKGSSRRNIPAL